MKTVSGFAEQFNQALIRKLKDYDEIRIVFDPCLTNALKSSTTNRNANIIVQPYAISDSLCIKKIGLKKFLAHDLTKRELGVYLFKSSGLRSVYM